MNNLAISLIRTWVPVAVGSLISWIASLGFQVDSQTRGSIVIGLTGLLIGLYYTAVRTLESRYPKLGMLLGTPQQPNYPTPTPVASLALQASTPVHAPTDPPKTL